MFVCSYEDEHIWFGSKLAKRETMEPRALPIGGDSCFAKVVPPFPVQKLLPFRKEIRALETRSNL